MRTNRIYLLIERSTQAPLYVGKSFDFEQRFYVHTRKYSKQGLEIDSIVLEIVENGNDWKEREQYWIAWFREFCLIDNILSGGDEVPIDFARIGGSKGKGKHKLGLKGRKRIFSDEHKLNMRKPKNNMHKRSMSLAQKGRAFSEEHRQALSISQLGKRKPTVSQALKGKIKSDLHKANLSKAKLGINNLKLSETNEEIRLIVKTFNCISFNDGRRILKLIREFGLPNKKY